MLRFGPSQSFESGEVLSILLWTSKHSTVFTFSNSTYPIQRVPIWLGSELFENIIWIVYRDLLGWKGSYMYIIHLLLFLSWKCLCVPDPRMKDRFMLFGTPVPVWILTALYLSFVYAGPKYMKNRQPFSLRNFMVIYNIGLVFMSIYMFVEVSISTRDPLHWIL